jgi:hypothetical protein
MLSLVPQVVLCLIIPFVGFTVLLRGQIQFSFTKLERYLGRILFKKYVKDVLRRFFRWRHSWLAEKRIERLNGWLNDLTYVSHS